MNPQTEKHLEVFKEVCQGVTWEEICVMLLERIIILEDTVGRLSEKLEE